ncbi:hypothetical protein Cgig2_019531 [Carnegiea gigantea]|uniref:Uncharacterized protein n=1 Tax=Carnegiea gigantea TaxID=171969 RepID=A0A9Q1KGI9_9CARY|nr:hypothetical protein Cgig2_019531 [Carnegiea gigantea]
MAFPHSLSTKEMAECVVHHFKWDRHRALSPSYELAVVEEAAEYFELSELPEVIFYAMLLNEAKRLGVLHGQALRTLESAFTELHWRTFESWVWLYDDRIFKTWFRTKRKAQGLGNRKRTQRRSRRVRARPLRGRPPLLTMKSKDGYVVEMNWSLDSWEYLPVP